MVAGTVATYVWINRVPTPYVGQILDVHVYPIHRDMAQKSTTEGMGGQEEPEFFDEINGPPNVQIQNVGKVPLFVHDMTATANLPDEADNSTATSASHFDKVFLAYPDLQQYKKAPLQRDITIQPGRGNRRQMIFNYQMTQQQWDTRSGMDISISFVHQPPMVMHVAK